EKQCGAGVDESIVHTGAAHVALGVVSGVDLDVHDLADLGGHRELAGVALRGKNPYLPRAIGGEEAEGSFITCGDLTDEVVGVAQQAGVGSAQRLSATCHRALDDGLVTRVDIGQGDAALGCSTTVTHLASASPTSTGTPRREPYSDQEPSEEHTSELQSRFDLVCRLL